MLPIRIVLLLLALALLAAGCGTTEQTQESPPEAPAPPAALPAEPPPQELRSRVDTVSVQQTTLPPLDSAGVSDLPARYVVQIGAFKDPALADAAQALARQRYAMTVLNDYNPLVGLYQIRVGFFDTKEEAYVFRTRIQNEFPEEYKDAWVVQFK